jgi:DNA-binding protein HU-beta
VNKAGLVAEIASSTGHPAAAVADVVEGFMDVVSAEVARGHKVVLSGFGTFYRKPRARRVARDIWAGQAVAVPATNVPAFRPGKPFRELVARPRGRGGQGSSRRRPQAG